jgi:hypothetical protein
MQHDSTELGSLGAGQRDTSSDTRQVRLLGSGEVMTLVDRVEKRRRQKVRNPLDTFRLMSGICTRPPPCCLAHTYLHSTIFSVILLLLTGYFLHFTLASQFQASPITQS